MNYFVITLFPEMINSYVNESIIGKAIKDKKIFINTFQLRDFSKDKHKRTDGIAYGGGPGMVLFIDPIINAFEKILKDILKEKTLKNRKIKDKNSKTKYEKNILIINFIPTAEKFTNILAKEISQKYTHIIFICGRYEGVDFRVNEIIKDILKNKLQEIKNKNKKPNFKFDIKNISIGDFILTGGELAANIMIDSISRQISGVLNKNESIEENRISSNKVYTRPEIYEKKYFSKNKDGIKKTKIKKYIVPNILLSGNHAEIDKWRKNNSVFE